MARALLIAAFIAVFSVFAVGSLFELGILRHPPPTGDTP
jgi:hypothetical protein